MRLAMLILAGWSVLAGAVDESRARLLAGFDTRSELAGLVAVGGVELSWSRTGNTRGVGAARLRPEGGAALATFDLAPGLLAGWEDFGYLALDCSSDASQPIPLTVEFQDRATTDFSTRATCEGRRAPRPVVPGPPRTILIDLRRAWRNRCEGRDLKELPDSERIDFRRLTTVRFWLDTSGFDIPPTVYLDNLRLLPAEAVGVPLRLDLPPGTLAFDFGEGTPVAPGFAEVTSSSAWTPGASFGFLDSTGLSAGGSDFPDPLAGDYVEARREDGQPTTFRVRLPDAGQWRLIVVAADDPQPGAQPLLAAGERVLLAGDYRTAEWFAAAARLWQLTGPFDDAGKLWTDAIEPVLQTFELAVEGSMLDLTLRDLRLGALLLVPAQAPGAAELPRLLAAARRECFEQAVAERLAGAPSRRLSPPTRIAGQAGETVWVEVALPVPGANWSLSPAEPLPATPEPIVGPLAIHVLTWRGLGASAVPWAMVPVAALGTASGDGWCEFTIPPGLAPGRYRLDGLGRPLDLRVLPPFELAPADVAFGLFYRPPWSNPDWRVGEQPELRRLAEDRLLPEQLAMLARFGLTSIEVPAPTFRQKDGGWHLEPGDAWKVAVAARAAGLGRTPSQLFPMHLLSLYRQAIRTLTAADLPPGEELRLPGYEPLLGGWLGELGRQAAVDRLPLAWWIVDEPRAKPMPWNRTLADTRTYCRIAARAGLSPRLLTLIRDRAGEVDYVRLGDEAEILALHPWPVSAGLHRRATTDPARRLWIFNAGQDRLSFGWHVWRVGAAGRFEWHFQTFIDEWGQDAWFGRGLHHPFASVAQRGATVPAPLDFPGAVFPTPLLVNLHDGILDYRYLRTLERELARATADGRAPGTVAEAARFLAACRASVPEFIDAPEVDRAALNAQLPDWRLRLAEYLYILTSQP